MYNINNLIDNYKFGVKKLREMTLNTAENMYLNRFVLIPNCCNYFYFNSFDEFKQKLLKEATDNTTGYFSAKITIIKPDTIIFNSKCERLLATTKSLFTINLEKRITSKTTALSYKNHRYKSGDVISLTRFTEYVYPSDTNPICDLVRSVSNNYPKKSLSLFSTSFANMAQSKMEYPTVQEFIDSLEKDLMEFLKG